MADDSADFNTFLEQCADPHRRIVLAVLAHEQRPLTLQDLTKAVVKHNHRQSPEEVSGKTIHQVQAKLYHTHIPNLENGSLVNYDTTRQLVEPTEDITQRLPTLSCLIKSDPDLEQPVPL